VIAVAFSLVGLVMRRYGYEPTPFVLAFVLGPILETALRRSLLLSDGSFLIFFRRPISAVLLGFAIVVLVAPLLTRTRTGEGLDAES
jgi:putative tricarboxylic transport membrane protein